LGWRVLSFGSCAEFALNSFFAVANLVDFAATLDARQPIQDQIALPANTELVSWMAEAPVGTRPLATVASSLLLARRRLGGGGFNPHPSSVQPLVLTLGLRIDGMPWCGAGLAPSEVEGLGQLRESSE